MIVTSLDFEFTGQDALKDFVIEYGSMTCKLDDGNMSHVQVRSSLVNNDISIPAVISGITHITNTDIRTMSVSSSFMEKELDEIDEVTDIYVTHNRSAEMFWNKRMKAENTICTYKVAYSLYTDLESYKLQSLRYELDLGYTYLGRSSFKPNPHRALPDAVLGMALFHEMLSFLTIDQMLVISNRPILLRKCPFGKHSGDPMDKVPTGYMEWAIGQENKNPGTFDEDVVYTFKHYLREAGKL